MKKFIFSVVAIIALTACVNSAKSSTETVEATDSVSSPIVNSWVQAIPGQDGEQGISIKADGTAESINMNTLRYKSWEQTNDSTVVLISESEGSGQAFTDTMTWSIVKLTPDSLIMKRGEIVEAYAAKK